MMTLLSFRAVARSVPLILHRLVNYFELQRVHCNHLHPEALINCPPQRLLKALMTASIAPVTFKSPDLPIYTFVQYTVEVLLSFETVGPPSSR
jgi:hypothetical protein